MSLPESPDALSEDVIMAYLEKFLDISDFKRIDNGKDLLDIVRKHPDHPRIKVVVRKVIGLFLCETPSAKVCALQFLKEAMEGNSWSVVEGVEKSVLASFAEIVEYRGSIPSLQRGSTYFLRSVPKNATDDEVMNLLKLSSTFFRMVHECVYVWGALYFPNSPFDRLRAKLAKRFVFPKFPQEFKFFNERKTDQFKANCREMVERMAQKVSTMVETASVLSRKSSSSVSKKKEERKDANSSEKTISAINVKEAFEQYAKGKSLKMTHIEHEELERDRGEKGKASLEKGKASLERGKANEKKGSKKEEKPQKKIHEPEVQDPDKADISQNNSSRLRKKNSFNEPNVGPLSPTLTSAPPPQITPSHPARPYISAWDSLAKNIQSIADISEELSSQEDGGRYSAAESSEPTKMSEPFEKSQPGDASPRSQYSMKNEPQMNRPQLPKQVSQQLQSVRERPNPREHMDLNLKLPVRKEEQSAAPISSDFDRENKTDRKNLSHRKKFVSSEDEAESVKGERSSMRGSIQQHSYAPTPREVQQSMIPQIKQEKKVYIPVIEPSPFATQKSFLIQSSPPSNNSPPPQPVARPTQPPAAAPPLAKVPKPQKIKSKPQIKTVFQIQSVPTVKPKEESATSIEANLKVNETKRSQSKQVLPVKQQISLPAVPMAVKYEKPQTNVSKNKPMKIEEQIDNLPEAIMTDNKNRRQSIEQVVKIPTKEKEVLSESKPKEKRVESNEKKVENVRPTYMMAQAEEFPPVQEIQVVEKQQVRPKASSLQKQSIFEAEDITTPIRQIKQQPNQTISYSSQKRQLFPESAGTRFRHHKEVSLLITPTHTYNQPAIKYDPEQIKSTVKDQIIQQISFLKNSLLSSQQERLNETINQLKSAMSSEKRQKGQEMAECSTQTLAKHKPKGKFDRRKKYHMSESEESKLAEDKQVENKQQPKIDIDHSLVHKRQNRLIENTNAANIPSHIPNQLTNQVQGRQNSERSRRPSLDRQSLQKEELKPGTLLYALYKRKNPNF